MTRHSAGNLTEGWPALIRNRNKGTPCRAMPCKYSEKSHSGASPRSRIHKRTQIVNARWRGNPPGGESPHYCRTEKRISDHG